jgi:tetratricopeptide (TPR) repeat protein
MIMKNTFLLILCFITFNIAQAQYKGSVSKAESALIGGKFADAKGEIDEAILNEKNTVKSKTWLVRGKIYSAIASSTDPAIAGLDANALDEAISALKKAADMEKEGTPSYFFATSASEDLWGGFINRGGVAYGNDNYDSAYMSFTQALKVRPGDSLTNFYAAAASQNNDNYADALKHYYEMVEYNVASEEIFSTIIYLERSQMKNEEKALAIVRKAKALFPGNDVFSKEEINILIAMEKVDEAREKLQDEIDSDPNNIALHLNLGILYDNLGAAEVEAKKLDAGRAAYAKSVKAYAGALGIESDNFIASYNTGAVYVNLAKIYLDQGRDMDLKTYQKEGAKLNELAKVELTKALPYLEIAQKKEPNDPDALRALYQVYQQLKMTQKANEVYEKIEALDK